MREDKGRVAAVLDVAVAQELTELERLAVARELLHGIVDDSFGGVIDPVLCVAEGNLGLAIEGVDRASQFVRDLTADQAGSFVPMRRE